MTVSCWECVRGHIMPVCCHTVFIEAEYACWWELWLKEKNSEFLTKICVCQWMMVELQEPLVLRTPETLRRREMKTISLHRPNNKMNLAGGYLQGL